MFWPITSHYAYQKSIPTPSYISIFAHQFKLYNTQESYQLYHTKYVSRFIFFDTFLYKIILIFYISRSQSHIQIHIKNYIVITEFNPELILHYFFGTQNLIKNDEIFFFWHTPIIYIAKSNKKISIYAKSTKICVRLSQVFHLSRIYFWSPSM